MKKRVITRYELLTNPFLGELLSIGCFNLAGIFAKKYIKIYEDFKINGWIILYE